ncbi:fatty acid desaturase family protein [Paenibacillus montanisoli]|uniref:Fatty acid desaturase n=1 Tax=Paenibacillus montanisoli TaxID=2081970 RepID=A0A328U7E1_9BACL|nr:fatty acid desaturase family protein [Paenibacillus montanisoli]RAP78440.1 fatty acid desaturase [Paenibacillus montanisoli]
MSEVIHKRDYSLLGTEGKLAEEKGLVSADWYTCPVPSKRLKELMKRKDGPALLHTFIWFVLLAGSGIVAYYAWGTWWAIPAFFLYGILYVTPSDSGWHESGHGTLFKTSWLNTVMFRLLSFMTFKNATVGRWSHVRHHSDTIVVGRDPETPVRPPVYYVLLMEFLRLNGAPKEMMKIFLHCFGRLDKQEREFVPVSQYRKVIWEARITMTLLLGVIVWSILIKSMLPVMFIVLPMFYGTALSYLITMAQHLGLSEDVLDHRLNTRTYYMNPIFRFLYWNMNYHIEHHMFPLVPFHALPALHKEMKDDCPAPYPSLWAALREIYSLLAILRKTPSYCIVRPLSDKARPYRFGPQDNQEQQKYG